MKELTENLIKAKAGEKAAMSDCYLVFDAITNDKTMREIIRSSKEDFGEFKNVIKLVVELAQAKELRALMRAKDLDDSNMLKLEEKASAFVKCYVRQHCSVYADLLFEIKETEVPAKKEPKEGEEEEKDDDETAEKRKRNTESKA